MRKVFSVALMAAMVCLVGMTKDAGANVTFSLVWTSTSGAGITGTNAIDAVAGDVLTLSIRMQNDQTMGAHAISVNFDTDLGNELNFFNGNLACVGNSCHGGGWEWAGTTYGTTTMVSTYAKFTTGVGGPVNVDSTGAVAGRLNTYESNVLAGPAFLPVGTYTIGTARFTVTGNVATDGLDLFTGVFNFGVDGMLDNLNNDLTTGLTFLGASVNTVIPEPGTASLLGLGLVGLVLAGRRSRR